MDGKELYAKSPEDAVETMISLYGDQLYRLCILYLKDIHDAQDAVQETFIKAYRHWEAFRHESSELTWLIRIAIRTCRDMRRKSWFHIVDRYWSIEAVEGSQMQTGLDGDVTQAVMELAEKYRLPILLHYYHGLSVKETAFCLQIPLNTALTRLRRGRELLRGKPTEGGELR